jgi:hypothetical protein
MLIWIEAAFYIAVLALLSGIYSNLKTIKEEFRRTKDQS